MQDLHGFTIGYGQHGNKGVASKTLCALELAGYLKDPTAPITDAPPCVCPVIRAFVIPWNDRLPTDADRAEWIGPIVALLLDTRSTPEIERRRTYLCADYAVRVFAPIALDSAGFGSEAKKLRSLDPIVDECTADAAYAAVYAAAAARSAADAAYAAVYAAADAAADAAAARSAADAAADAAYAADAARSAADRSAAYAARSAADAADVNAASQKLVRELCAIS